MHPITLTSRKSRRPIWFIAALVMMFITWIMIIQTVQASNNSTDHTDSAQRFYSQASTAYPTPGQVGTLVPLDSGENDAYGSSVAVSGDTVVVGAPYNDHDDLPDAGKIYVYQWNGTIWALQTELVPSDAAASDNFGATVGLYGNTIIAGAPGDDDGGSDSGAAYVFVRDGSTWSQQIKLFSPDANANDRFGNTVSISVESVLISASGDDQAAADAGAAYAFARSGATWSLQQKLMAGDPLAGSMFGSALDLYGDTAVIGAPLPATAIGSAYVFVREWNTANWSQQQKLAPSTPAIGIGDHFGAAVAVYNETIIVGAPQAEISANTNVNDGAINVFNRSNGVWTLDSNYLNVLPTAQSAQEPQFGASAVDVYRETFLAGVPGRLRIPGQNPGAAYLIGKSTMINGWWLMGTPAANHAQVGAAVARDGNTVVVGAPADDFFAADSGAAYIFRVVAPPWEPIASITPSYTPSPTLTPSNTPGPTNTPPTPTSPPNSTPGPHFFAERHPTLTWDNITWALGYHIEIDDDLAFNSPISGETNANTLSYTTVEELADGVYYWRVQAKLNDVEWGDWSATETIIVSAP
jgi:hypothetical protein